MNTSRPRLIIAAVGVLTAAIWIAALLPGPKTLQVTFLDVGEGLCAVVVSPSGRTLVMDCGTSSWRKSETVGEKVAARYLQILGRDRIDVAVLSHPHSDHLSGFARLLQLEPAGLVLDIGARSVSPEYRRFLRVVKRSGATYRIAKRGQTLDLGCGAIAQVLSPVPGRRYEDLNNNSIVLRVIYRHVAVLLAADACQEAEQGMLGSGLALRSQVVQVGHHGGADATGESWLAAVRPAVAIVSCGRRNEYGHPSKEVLDRINAFGARIYRTDQGGAVSINTDGEAVRVNAYRDTR